MGSKKSLHVRDALLLLLAFVLVLGVCYKYFEWDSLKKVMSLANSTMNTELSKSEEINQYFNTDISPKLEYAFSDKVTSPEDFVVAMDELRAEIKITMDMDKGYLTLLENNRSQLAQLKLRRMLLIGKPRKFFNNFLTNLLDSYDAVIKQTEIDSIDNKFIGDYFMVSRDTALSNDFFNKAPPGFGPSMVSYVQTNFSKLGALEKYTKDDFRFTDEESYKTNNPYGYEILLKYKDYLKTYYFVMRDIASNDLDSAQYKASTLQEKLLAINVDNEKLFGEGDEKKNSLRKANLLSIAKMVEASKDFSEMGIKQYPMLGSVGVFNDDLALCGSYITKAAGLYKNITSKYPESTDSRSLVKELSKIEPNTDFVDSRFDYDVLQIVSNDERSIKFECLNKGDQRVYKFETIK